MLPTKRGSEAGPDRLGVVLLAAGYGTRLQRELSAAPHLSALLGVPKPLLPVLGAPILSHWVAALDALPTPATFVVVTNAAHEPLYNTWAEQQRAAGVRVSVVSDGSTDNASRLGAVKDIDLALAELRKSDADTALIIAGDTLLPGADIPALVSQFAAGPYAAATFAYPLADKADCVRRGMFRTRQEAGVTIAEALVEKPRTPEEAPSNLASAPLYILRKHLWQTFDEFVKLREGQGAPLEMRDAPGFWLAFLVQREPCRLFCVEKRIDIGGLAHYRDALWELNLPESQGMLPGARKERSKLEPAVGRAYPRIGLLGNPSDGYGGKVISVCIASEGYGEVMATASEKFRVHHNPEHELDSEFDNLSSFVQHVSDHSLHFGARSLVLAAAVVFAKEYRKYYSRKAGKSETKYSGDDILASLPPCQLVYSTTIPARIGLSGSSAFILATFRAMASFYNTSLEELNSDMHAWPVLMQSAETDLLGIACGLQDRVTQVMQGCVAMDFTNTSLTSKASRWQWLSEKALPQLWLVYHDGGRVGECSGVVHSDLKARYLAKDSDVLHIVKHLCDVTDSGRKMLEAKIARGDAGLDGFADLVNKNFELRIALVGADAVGRQSRNLVSVAKEAGFAAKMSGSGGCAVCVPNPVRELKEEEVATAAALFQYHGMVLHKVEVLPRRNWKV